MQAFLLEAVTQFTKIVGDDEGGDDDDDGASPRVRSPYAAKIASMLRRWSPSTEPSLKRRVTEDLQSSGILVLATVHLQGPEALEGLLSSADHEGSSSSPQHYLSGKDEGPSAESLLGLHTLLVTNLRGLIWGLNGIVAAGDLQYPCTLRVPFSALVVSESGTVVWRGRCAGADAAAGPPAVRLFPVSVASATHWAPVVAALLVEPPEAPHPPVECTLLPPHPPEISALWWWELERAMRSLHVVGRSPKHELLVFVDQELDAGGLLWWEGPSCGLECLAFRWSPQFACRLLEGDGVFSVEERKDSVFVQRDARAWLHVQSTHQLLKLWQSPSDTFSFNISTIDHSTRLCRLVRTTLVLPTDTTSREEVGSSSGSSWANASPPSPARVAALPDPAPPRSGRPPPSIFEDQSEGSRPPRVLSDGDFIVVE